MSIRDEFEFKVIDVLTTTGPEASGCWVRGDFAVHDVLGQGYSEIVHIVSATAFPARFSVRESAMKAAKDIQRIRNDWSDFDVRSITPDLRRAVRGIIERHHGVFYGNRALSKATAPMTPRCARGGSSIDQCL